MVKDVYPHLLGLFQRLIEGDDALMELGKIRFQEAGLGPEFYAGSPRELEEAIAFHPFPGTAAMVHLSRKLTIAEEKDRDLIEAFAATGENLMGFVIHDHPLMASDREYYLYCARDMEKRLSKKRGRAILFIEYAVGIPPETFIEFFHQIRDLERVSACIDIGHTGIRQARKAYADIHPGEDICNLTPYTENLNHYMEDVDKALMTSLPVTLDIIREISNLKKDLHFHLHDGHPLSTYSPYGVSDHLSFFDAIPLPFEYRGKRSLDLMYGPEGLGKVVEEAQKDVAPEKLSFTLEIHPRKGGIPLEHVRPLFAHWEDKTHARWMNYWLSLIAQNASLLKERTRAPRHGDA